MIFVSMTNDELFERTAQYRIQCEPSRSDLRHDPGPLIYSVHHGADGSTRYSSRYRRAHNIHNDDEEQRTARIPPEFNIPPPPFNVTTECSEDEVKDNESETEMARGLRHYHSPRRAPNRIGALPFESDDDDDDDGDDDDEENPWAPSGPNLYDYEEDYRRYSSSRAIDRGQHSGGGSLAAMTLDEAREASQIATQEAVRAVGGELMPPLAHFLIDKDKDKCTIRFDPPVSGRFILLKMWRKDLDKNIDIRAIIAVGYAGPRQFPAVELL